MSNGRIWITGGGGFFGKSISRRLGERALVTSRSEVDLLDRKKTADFVNAGQLDSIIHAAGFVGGIGLNQAHPGRMAADNLRMGLNLLEAAADRGGVHVVIVSTVCVYPADAPVPTPETAIFDGAPAEVTSFYGIAKRTLLTLAEGLKRERGLSYTYVIPTNLYVDDAAEGVESALDRTHSGGVYNLGSGVERSIRELAEIICRLVGFTGKLVWDTSKPGGAPRRALDPSRARRDLGFAARTGLEEGLARTIEWYAQGK